MQLWLRTFNCKCAQAAMALRSGAAKGARGVSILGIALVVGLLWPGPLRLAEAASTSLAYSKHRAAMSRTRTKSNALRRDIAGPREVHYTIQRGGTLRNVANLYRIYHHEIRRLNPKIALDKPLAPRKKVVVYRRSTRHKSQSVGRPHQGSLVAAVPMNEGPGRSLRAKPWKRWATAYNVATLDRVFRRWAQKHPRSPILVGNLSARKGGRLRPHQSHRSGRDVDLGYIQKKGVYRELNWRRMHRGNFDAKRTWELIELLLQTGRIEKIFIDRSLQVLLYRYARRTGRYSRARLRRVLQYPGRSGRAIILHSKGHIDHMHLRFRCAPHEGRCR